MRSKLEKVSLTFSSSAFTNSRWRRQVEGLDGCRMRGGKRNSGRIRKIQDRGEYNKACLRNHKCIFWKEGYSSRGYKQNIMQATRLPTSRRICCLSNIVEGTTCVHNRLCYVPCKVSFTLSSYCFFFFQGNGRYFECLNSCVWRTKTTRT